MDESMIQFHEDAEDKGEITAQTLMQTAQEDEGQDADARGEERGEEDALEACKAGIRSLMDDGWTSEELRALAADEGVRQALARGESLRRAATAFLRGGAQRGGRKRGVPVFRAAATGGPREADPIAQMTDEEFEAFSRRAMEAALSGVKVRIG